MHIPHCWKSNAVAHIEMVFQFIYHIPYQLISLTLKLPIKALKLAGVNFAMSI